MKNCTTVQDFILFLSKVCKKKNLPTIVSDMHGLMYISVHKPRIFWKFSKAKVGGIGLCMRAHFLQKMYTRKSQNVYIFYLKTTYKVKYW